MLYTPAGKGDSLEPSLQSLLTRYAIRYYASGPERDAFAEHTARNMITSTAGIFLVRRRGTSLVHAVPLKQCSRQAGRRRSRSQ